MTLAAALARLPDPQSEWDGRVSLDVPQGAHRLSDLAVDGATLAGLVTTKRDQARGGDDRLGCGCLIGDLGWSLGNLLGGLWLHGWHVAKADTVAIALTLRPVTWEEDGEGGTAHVIDLHVDPHGISRGPDTPLHLARTMEGLHEGIIAVLARSTGLSQAAQWRLVGDGLSGALLENGKTLVDLPGAIALGRAILGDRATRLHSRQTDFVEIALPGDTPSALPRARDWFRLRGGCCRYYTSRGGEYCSTCVLRNRDDQIARLTAYLAGTLA